MNADQMIDAMYGRRGRLSLDEATLAIDTYLAPDSPLVWHTVTDTGDVIDVRAALEDLRELGRGAREMWARKADQVAWLVGFGLTHSLADLCIRLAGEAS